MYRALHWAYAFGVPIFVTENGVEDADDDLRPRYLAQHVHQVWRAVQEGLPVQGYFHWTLVDNFEWDRGWTQRFGLWALDVEEGLPTPLPEEVFEKFGLTFPGAWTKGDPGWHKHGVGKAPRVSRRSEKVMREAAKNRGSPHLSCSSAAAVSG